LNLAPFLLKHFNMGPGRPPAPAAQPRPRPAAPEVRWTFGVPTTDERGHLKIVRHRVVANTKSEARAVLKRDLGLDRLPVGTVTFAA
jgi:hypothetical protein